LPSKSTPARRHGDELPKELVDFDKSIPLIAEPGSDRRNNVPANIREQARELFERDRSLEAKAVKEQETLQVARLREADAEREREIEQHREVERIPVVASAEESHRLSSGFLGLNTVGVSADRSAPVTTTVPASRLTTRAAGNHFLNLDYDPKPPSTGVSGPSFLGLSDSPEDMEQDEPESHARRTFALVVLLLLVGLGAKQWNQIRDQALPFVKNGTQKVMLKVKGKMAPPAADDSTSANANGTSSEPKIEVAPTNDNLKKAEPAANDSTTASGAAGTPGGTTDAAKSDAANAPTNSTNAAGTAANAAAGTGGAVGAAIPKESDTAKSEADDTEEPAKPAAKETEKKSAAADASPRKARKPSAADRPQITDDEPQAGGAELAQANATSNPAVQRQLLWQAVKKGNSDASVKLAELYIVGRGVDKSCDQAMVLLRSASAHNSARARGKLGAMYATGECVDQDRVQAYHWMSMALEANPGSDWTARYRESIWNQMTSGEKMRARKDR